LVLIVVYLVNVDEKLIKHELLVCYVQQDSFLQMMELVNLAHIINSQLLLVRVNVINVLLVRKKTLLELDVNYVRRATFLRMIKLDVFLVH